MCIQRPSYFFCPVPVGFATRYLISYILMNTSCMSLPLSLQARILTRSNLLSACLLYLVHYIVLFIDDSPTLSDSTLHTRASETRSDDTGVIGGD